ncbi:heavy-metal-associated domain-containing protein [Thermoactinomyces mirandus]|uniref:Heavy-metal-associated domain-containing protein n=1 Tax=Thermoactinomyces mirandus TaxID=2756294 RepID=A0A7W1XRH6_9BACL|nr:heavy-metal-associated domain-containing protein [Thermoactinomyces mirandus]MBA4601846.1 heavy-metal-associated domain-containing protein [Thermoactinomyces mirandus]
MTKAVFHLKSLTCPSCMQKIETALMKITDACSAKVFFNSGKVRAEFDESSLQAEELEKAITRLGYPVKSVKLSQS